MHTLGGPSECFLGKCFLSSIYVISPGHLSIYFGHVTYALNYVLHFDGLQLRNDRRFLVCCLDPHAICFIGGFKQKSRRLNNTLMQQIRYDGHRTPHLFGVLFFSYLHGIIVRLYFTLVGGTHDRLIFNYSSRVTNEGQYFIDLQHAIGDMGFIGPVGRVFCSIRSIQEPEFIYLQIYNKTIRVRMVMNKWDI